MRFFFIIFGLILLSSCSSQLNTDYLTAKNGRLVKIPAPYTAKEMSYSYVLKASKKPVHADYTPPKVIS